METNRTRTAANIADEETDLDPPTGRKENSWMAHSINSKMVAIGKTCLKTFPLTRAVYWHYKQWRAEGTIETLMSVLHGQMREQVKKKLNGQR